MLGIGVVGLIVGRVVSRRNFGILGVAVRRVVGVWRLVAIERVVMRVLLEIAFRVCRVTGAVGLGRTVVVLVLVACGNVS